MKSTTSGGTLYVFLDPSPQPVRNNDQTKFKVIFLQKGGIDTVQNHIAIHPNINSQTFSSSI